MGNRRFDLWWAVSDSSTKIADLLQLSHDLGREDRALAVLGEGNASSRLDTKNFLVKASGCSMADLTQSQLVVCRFASLLPLLDAPDATDAEVEQALMASRGDGSPLKPSVEAIVHAYLLTLPGIEVVGHTHPLTVNQILCSEEALAHRFALDRRFPDEIVCCGPKSVWVPYIDPGLQLARGIRDWVEAFMAAEGRTPRVILLQNHGFIACGPTTGSVLAATLMAEKAARIFAGATVTGGVAALDAGQVMRIDSRSDEHYRQRMLKI